MHAETPKKKLYYNFNKKNIKSIIHRFTSNPPPCHRPRHLGSCDSARLKTSIGSFRRFFPDYFRFESRTRSPEVRKRDLSGSSSEKKRKREGIKKENSNGGRIEKRWIKETQPWLFEFLRRHGTGRVLEGSRREPFFLITPLFPR